MARCPIGSRVTLRWKFSSSLRGDQFGVAGLEQGRSALDAAQADAEQLGGFGVRDGIGPQFYYFLGRAAQGTFASFAATVARWEASRWRRLTLTLTTKPSGSLSRQVAALVSRHAPTSPEEKAAAPPVAISVTGHSLAPALACLYVLKTPRRTSCRPRLSASGLARVGDRAFVTAFNGLGLTSSRFAIDQDLVPQLPGILWFPARQYTSISERNREGAAKPLVLARADELSEPRQPEPAAGSVMRDRDRCRCKSAWVAGGTLDLSLNTGLD